ncbi:MAG: hypothetical protein JNK33_01960 [Candidatus Doudnabacteria bacterium]|nr:hypothetical protein [Candidatus Doudnabacteria bacterium]
MHHEVPPSQHMSELVPIVQEVGQKRREGLERKAREEESAEAQQETIQELRAKLAAQRDRIKDLERKIESATALHIASLIAMAEKHNTVNDLSTAEDIARRFLAEYGTEDLTDVVSYELAVVLNLQGKYVDSLNVLQKLDEYLSEKIKEAPAESRMKEELLERQAVNLPRLQQAVVVLMDVVPSGPAREGYERLLDALKLRQTQK